MKCQILFPVVNKKKNITNFLSAELAKRGVKNKQHQKFDPTQFNASFTLSAYTITKTRLFKYIENLTIKKLKVFR